MKKSCQGNPFCNLLDAEARELLCQHVTITHMAPKQIETSQFDGQISIVSEGILLKYSLLEDGSQQSIELITKNGLLGEHLLFDPSTNYPNYHLMALSNIRKCNYPVKIFEQLFKENPAFSQLLLKNLTSHLARNHTDWIKFHALNGVEKVIFVYDTFKGKGVDMNILTQEELAMITGVSRITVVRALKQLTP